MRMCSMFTLTGPTLQRPGDKALDGDCHFAIILMIFIYSMMQGLLDYYYADTLRAICRDAISHARRLFSRLKRIRAFHMSA